MGRTEVSVRRLGNVPRAPRKEIRKQSGSSQDTDMVSKLLGVRGTVHLKGHVNLGSPRSRHQNWANTLLPVDAKWHECILEMGLDKQESY